VTLIKEVSKIKIHRKRGRKVTLKK